ncbi:MAG: hypothetical protein WKF84_11350 [Pyrinomonadaceae bacterium]
MGHHNVLADPEELLVYECDGLPQHKFLPRAVVFPNSTDEVSRVVRTLVNAGVSVLRAERAQDSQAVRSRATEV